MTAEQVQTQPEITPSGSEVKDVAPPSSGGATGEPVSILDAITRQAEPPSSSANPEVKQEVTPAVDAAPAQSSAEAAKGEGQEQAQPASSSASPDPAEGTGSEEDLSGELTPEERRHMNERTQRRIDTLLRERRAARVEAEKAQPIVKFMADNDIPQQDVDVILGLAAQLRHGDFAGFLRTVSPYVELAQQYVGERLPVDLQQQVNQGAVNPAVARELAQRRAAEVVHRQQAERTDTARQREVVELRAQTLRNAVVNWETAAKQRDPDYGAKSDAVKRITQALIQEQGAPTTPEAAVRLVQQAYDEATRMVGSFRPQPKPTLPQPSSVHPAASAPQPEARSVLDAVRAAAGR